MSKSVPFCDDKKLISGDEFDDNADGNYKSCFARSVAVNSQLKNKDPRQLHQQPPMAQELSNSSPDRIFQKGAGPAVSLHEGVRLRKVSVCF